MRFRFPLSWPSRADGTLLPAVLAGLLVVGLVGQCVATGGTPDLPPVMAVGAARTRLRVPTVVPVSVARVIVDRPLFAPRQSVTSAADGNPPSILGGASVAGTMAIRGRTYAVVRRPDGTSANLSVGATLGGWRLVALGQQGATFVKGGDRRVVAYGASAPVAEAADAPSE